ncbi:hypothetical protein E5288_WYG009509 [Bos mutus]|uniref:Uncharacterized protein n=1 Tax=Bos mutus TaxID=72004 RepID=A0A6B0RP08_9CETA|nr:hypothetical protein [Bos mutus]
MGVTLPVAFLADKVRAFHFQSSLFYALWQEKLSPLLPEKLRWEGKLLIEKSQKNREQGSSKLFPFAPVGKLDEDQSYLIVTSRPCDAEAGKYLLTPYLDYLLPFFPSVGRSFCCDGK